MTLLSERPAPAGVPKPPAGGIATRLEELVAPMFGGSLPFRLRAWDGSEAGPGGTREGNDDDVVVLRSPAALRRLVWAPGELGLAQAYVTGELDVEGDLQTALERVWATVRERDLTGRRLSAGLLAKAVRTAADLGVIGRPLP